MDDDRLHQPAQKSSKQADHLPLLPLAPSFSSPQLPTTGLPSAALTPIAPLVYRRSSILSHPDDSHGRHVDAFTDWIVRLTYELVALSQGPPLVVPLTVTFSPGSIRPDQVLREYERFYARLCRLLMCNPERPSKRHLLPFAIAFRDDPSTRPGKHRARPSAHAVFSNHPSVAPHVHSVLVVHPTLVDRFMEIVDTLEETWRRIPVWTADPTSALDAPRYVNRSLHADVPFALGIRELMIADPIGSRPLIRARIRRVVDYSAKLGRRRRTSPTTLTSSPCCRPLRRSPINSVAMEAQRTCRDRLWNMGPLPGYVSNHVPRARTPFSADFGGYSGVAFRRLGSKARNFSTSANTCAGNIYVAERPRKGRRELLWSVIPKALNLPDVRIDPSVVPERIRRAAYRHLARE
jgi:hypothetical protein